jgi:hypothetical protein
MNWKPVFVGLCFDIVDWVIIGLIPIVFDVFDFLCGLYWYTKVGAVGLASLIEVIPGLDVLPTNIALGVYAGMKEDKKRG